MGLGGARPAEIAARTPADALVAHPRARWVRAATADATPDRVWRWLCQLTVAPYSYDLIDNLGRRSPHTLTPGADDLRVGQRLLVLFVVDSFATGEQLTLRRRRPGHGSVGEFAITYRVVPEERHAAPGAVAEPGPGDAVPAASAGAGPTTGRGPGVTRLVATVVVGGTDGPIARTSRAVLGWGDLVMMRRQLRTLARLAATG